jgi:hypothetical protein
VTARLTTAAYVLGYASALGALVAGCALAPRATGAVVVAAAGWALWRVWRMPLVTP